MIGNLFMTNRKTFMGEVEQTSFSSDACYTKIKIPAYREIDCFDGGEVLLCVGKTECKGDDYVFYSFGKNKKGWLRNYEVRLVTDSKIKIDL